LIRIFLEKIKFMLRSGFEPESSARKAGMIDRTTLPEHSWRLCILLAIQDKLPDLEGMHRYMYISKKDSPGRIRTAVAGSKGLQD
jgi:hypothetical protein